MPLQNRRSTAASQPARDVPGGIHASPFETLDSRAGEDTPAPATAPSSPGWDVAWGSAVDQIEEYLRPLPGKAAAEVRAVRDLVKRLEPDAKQAYSDFLLNGGQETDKASLLFAVAAASERTAQGGDNITTAARVAIRQIMSSALVTAARVAFALAKTAVGL